MKKLIILVISGFVSLFSYGQNDWPVLKHYDQDHLAKIALPIGGIGTGTVSIGGSGDLRDWEIMNRPAKGFLAGPGGNRAPFFAIYTKTENEKPQTRALMGPIELTNCESMEGRGPANHGLPRFRECSFDAAYPFGQVNLSDDDMPVNVTLQTFNPLIPGDVNASSIPIAVLHYLVTNKTDKIVTTSICGVMENFIGTDGSAGYNDWKGDFIPTGSNANKNIFKKGNTVQGIYMFSEGVDKNTEQWGTIALTTDAKSGISYRTNTIQGGWGNGLLNFWDDFSGDGILTEKEWPKSNTPQASLAAQTELLPHETKEITFFLTWHFPNRMAWASSMLMNYYTTQYTDAWDVIEKIAPELPVLENKTIEFVSAFCESDLPEVVKESALFNASTLRSQTCFRTADGNFYGWEGVMDKVGSCMGSCTHVWNYEQTTPFLFGELAKTMRKVEFAYATADNGVMSFRVNLPLEYAKTYKLAAADGQMGTIMKIYRDWQLSGDDEFLEALWPNIKRALAFAWIDKGWDADADGVMEGCQHNTMDVEYYGPNPQMQLWYLGALRAAEEMALHLNDKKFSKTCRSLFMNGSRWTDANLFNGEYYFHELRPPVKASDIAENLRAGMGAIDLTNPDFQLANGCLVDQMVGQYMAHICGLGYLVNPENVKTSLNSIMKYNYKPSVHDHFNNMRSYVLGNESALLMASFPYDRPEKPFPYFSEVMTGFEYTAAVGMLYEGLTKDGLLCIKNVRDRYDGRKRSPFNEAECGNHYARAMAAWAEVLAITGFHFSNVDHSISFNAGDGNFFWANGYSYGTVKITANGNNKNVYLKVLRRELELKNFILNGFGSKTFSSGIVINEGETRSFTIENNNSKIGLSQYNIKEVSKIPVLKAPQIKNSKGEIIRNAAFTDNIEISIESNLKGAKIYYTTDGSRPDLKSKLYKKPLHFSESVKIKAIAVKDKYESTFYSVLNLFKIKDFKQLKLTSQPAKKYCAKGEFSLVDGEMGSSNFTDGKWLGFQGDNLELIVEFKNETNIQNIIVNCLKNERSWIFLPENVQFFISTDGKSFFEHETIGQQVTVQTKNSDIFELKNEFENLSTRYLKIIVKNIGECPEGHQAAGENAWIFVDEIIIE